VSGRWAVRHVLAAQVAAYRSPAILLPPRFPAGDRQMRSDFLARIDVRAPRERSADPRPQNIDGCAAGRSTSGDLIAATTSSTSPNSWPLNIAEKPTAIVIRMIIAPKIWPTLA
jgi:hypothetical protein